MVEDMNPGSPWEVCTEEIQAWDYVALMERMVSQGWEAWFTERLVDVGRLRVHFRRLAKGEPQ